MQTRIEVFNQHQQTRVKKDSLVRLIENLLIDEVLSAREINVILVDDHYLRKLHRDYLKEDSFTDVMTFNLSGTEAVEGEIYISIDRATVHAAQFNVPLEEELTRLVVHGILHLKGYDDKTDSERRIMRQKETYYLKKYPSAVVLL